MSGLPYSHDISRAFTGGITQVAFEKNLQRLVPALAAMREAYENKSLAHLRLPERTDDLRAIELLARKLQTLPMSFFSAPAAPASAGKRWRSSAATMFPASAICAASRSCTFSITSTH